MHFLTLNYNKIRDFRDFIQIDNWITNKILLVIFIIAQNLKSYPLSPISLFKIYLISIFLMYEISLFLKFYIYLYLKKRI